MVRLLMTGSDSGELSSAEEIVVPAGFAGPPPHRHRRTNHAWFVVEGELLLTAGDARESLAAGGFVYVPVDTPHTFANPSAATARMVEFTTPGGFDRYLDEVAAAFPAGSELDRDRMVEIMARHDTFPV
ncbi:MAG: cupin domain-containing protein [Acidimicrobiia bacterium]